MKVSEKFTLAAVIPCWNEEKLLPEMLDCLLKQTYPDWTVICVDDQSTDKTAEIIRSYQTKDKRIQYFCRDREPKGGQTCRNIGFEKAADAKYVCYFDADDLVAPYCFEQRVKFMETHPELDCGVFPVIAYTDDIHEEYGPVFGVKMFDDDLEAMLNLNIPMAVSTNIYRYDALQDKGIKFDEKVQSMQDSDFSFQVILSGMHYTYATEAKVDYFYRVTNDGVASGINSAKKWQSHVYLAQKVTDNVTKKYGDKYDMFLGIYVAQILKKIGFVKEAYDQLSQATWVRKHWEFRMRMCVYRMLKMQRLWSLLFYRYRNVSKKRNAIWQASMAEKRKILLSRGVEI